MIYEHYGNLFEKYELAGAPETGLNVIVHGCNAQGKMGSGFAKELRTRFPEAYERYIEVYNLRGLELGDTVYYDVSDQLCIANCITQKFYGYDGEKYVSYDAIDNAMLKMNELIGSLNVVTHIHFPKIGAYLGGGNWNVIKEIIDHRMINAYKHLYILK